MDRFLVQSVTYYEFGGYYSTSIGRVFENKYGLICVYYKFR